MAGLGLFCFTAAGMVGLSELIIISSIFRIICDVDSLTMFFLQDE